MELKGTVILDKETMSKLKDQIREEVIEDIKNDGNYFSEIEKYLNDCDFESYITIIKGTIDNIISKTDENDIHFDSGWKKWHELLAIKRLFDI